MKPSYSAADIKERFAAKAYYRSFVVVHEAEMLYYPDIATIRRNLKLSEYEIKTSLEDLRRELDIIERVVAEDGMVYRQEMPTDRSLYARWFTRMNRGNKYAKHRHYLRGYTEDERMLVPNYFYFIVPTEFYLRERLRFDRLPYGVLEASFFSCLKKPRRLHDGTVTTEIMWFAAQNLMFRLKRALKADATPSSTKNSIDL